MMVDIALMILLLVGGFMVWLVIHQQYYRWKAGKLADKMLKDVIRGKAAFRR
ncbi:MAG: hypothetical protein ABL983_17290 [Nitrospira sp.]